MGGEEQGDDSEDHEAESHQGYGSNRKGTSPSELRFRTEAATDRAAVRSLPAAASATVRTAPASQGGSQIEKKAPAHRMPQIPTIPTSLFLGGQKPQSCSQDSFRNPQLEAILR